MKRTFDVIHTWGRFVRSNSMVEAADATERSRCRFVRLLVSDHDFWSQFVHGCWSIYGLNETRLCWELSMVLKWSGQLVYICLIALPSLCGWVGHRPLSNVHPAECRPCGTFLIPDSSIIYLLVLRSLTYGPHLKVAWFENRLVVITNHYLIVWLYIWRIFISSCFFFISLLMWFSCYIFSLQTNFPLPFIYYYSKGSYRTILVSIILLFHV